MRQKQTDISYISTGFWTGRKLASKDRPEIVALRLILVSSRRFFAVCYQCTASKHVCELILTLSHSGKYCDLRLEQEARFCQIRKQSLVQPCIWWRGLWDRGSFCFVFPFLFFFFVHFTIKQWTAPTLTNKTFPGEVMEEQCQCSYRVNWNYFETIIHAEIEISSTS